MKTKTWMIGVVVYAIVCFAQVNLGLAQTSVRFDTGHIEHSRYTSMGVIFDSWELTGHYVTDYTPTRCTKVSTAIFGPGRRIVDTRIFERPTTNGFYFLSSWTRADVNFIGRGGGSAGLTNQIDVDPLEIEEGMVGNIGTSTLDYGNSKDVTVSTSVATIVNDTYGTLIFDFDVVGYNDFKMYPNITVSVRVPARTTMQWAPSLAQVNALLKGYTVKFIVFGSYSTDDRAVTTTYCGYKRSKCGIEIHKTNNEKRDKNSVSAG
jgi:hypothetical protein